MAKVWINDYEVQALADLIREYKKSNETFLPVEMESELRTLLNNTGGGGNELPNWYDYFTNISFAGATFPAGTDVVIDLPRWNGSIVSFNGAKGMRSIKIKTPFLEGAMTAANYFAYTNTYTGEDVLETIDLSETRTIFTSIQNFVPWRKSLVSIIGEIELSNVTSTSNAFSGCYELKDIRFVKNCINRGVSFSYSSKLSPESVQSIIDGLVDLTGKDALTITFHSDVLVTTEQREQALAKNWNIAGGKTE